MHAPQYDRPIQGRVRPLDRFVHRLLDCLLIGWLLMLLLYSDALWAASVVGASRDPQCGVSMSCASDSTPASTPQTPPSSSPVAGQASCGIAAGGAPCAGSINVGAGNPINLITGNKYQREVDLPALPGVLGLEIVRHYNSAYSTPHTLTGILGRGWKLSYETDLYVTGNTIQILQADGTRVMFSRDPRHPSLCTSLNPADGQLRIARNSRGEEYLWIWRDGRVLRFDSAGKLIQIAVQSGEFVTLQRDPAGLLVQVTDPQGRKLHLSYPPRGTSGFHGVATIDSPVGRFSYRYGSTLPVGASSPPAGVLANLVSVGYPANGGQRIYHYEDARHPTFMTGISVGGRRIGTYLYDINGKAILTVRGEPARLQLGPDRKPLSPARLVPGTGVGQVTLDYSIPGRTVLANSLGQETVYRHTIIAGEYRLLDVRGPGCHQCGETNVRYAYDGMGRLVETTWLDHSGFPIAGLTNALDTAGRTIQITRITYHDGKQKSKKWLARYEYDDQQTMPRLIARPSVVAGHQTNSAFSYNEKGQLQELRETGWSPGIAPAAIATMIERTIRYHYKSINGRSVLVEIDGPLANAKDGSHDDADIFRAIWDDAGNYISKVITPGDVSTTLDYDSAGRMVKVTDDENKSTTFSYNARGQLVSSRTGSITQSMRYDPGGHLVETGDGEGDAYKANFRSGLDNAGRTTWQASALGILRSHRYDTEDHLLETVLQAAGFRGIESYDYDDLGRLVATTDADRGTRHIHWNDRNLVDRLTDRLGREKHYDYDDGGLPTRITDAANSLQAKFQNTATRFEHDDSGREAAIIAPNNGITRVVRDDFGRAIAITSPDSGTVTRTFAASGQLVASTDANGNRANYEWDSMGRVVRQTINSVKTVDSTKANLETRWRYDRHRLLEVRHPDQSERYRYDQNGYLSCRETILRLENGTYTHSFTQYIHGANGQLESMSLPDGSFIDFQRDKQGQVVALQLRQIRTPWLQWLLPVKPVVRALERDIGGIKSYIYGNGIEAHFQRSMEGALTRIAYLRPNQGNSKESIVNVLSIPLGIGSAQAAAETESPPKAGLQPLGAIRMPPDTRALLDDRFLWDAEGNLLYTQSKSVHRYYAYDALDRLIASSRTASDTTDQGSLSTPPEFARYFYDGTGNRILTQEASSAQTDLTSNTEKLQYADGKSQLQGLTVETHVDYDAVGQPTNIGTNSYEWDALGKLISVRQSNKTKANYRYNFRGERIGKSVGGRQTHYLYENRFLSSELDQRGKILRQYLYLADQPIAIIDTREGIPLDDGMQSGWADIAHDVRTLWTEFFGDEKFISYLHNDHLGAPVLATDSNGHPIWHAVHNGFGYRYNTEVREDSKGKKSLAKFRLNLRLPGQYEDEETGLYYNDHRYYDPRRGRYLTPDPLGLKGGINVYAYTAGNPLKYVDPSGLILFAFDGTGNSDPAAPSDSISNVRKFYEAYTGVDHEDKFYITGIGTTNEDMHFKGSIYDGTGFDQRVRLGFDFLNNLINSDQGTSMLDIDVVGFSRGAAEARVWTAQLTAALVNGAYKTNIGKSRCLELRFEGLWDSVSHLGYLNRGYLSTTEPNYDFSIPASIKYVAQAVALNEYRGGAANFDFRSINGSEVRPSDNRIERGFIGSHSDIGGGYGTGDLSDVALMWMVSQAKTAGLSPFLSDSLIHRNGWDVVSSPIVHDKSGYQTDPAGQPTSTDRLVAFNDGKTIPFSNATFSGMNRKDTSAFISYLPTFCDMGVGGKAGENPEVGNVNMSDYSHWLKLNYGMDIGFDQNGRQACAPL